MAGLDITLKGRLTIVYCELPVTIAKELSDKVLGGHSGAAQPILVLFGPSGDLDGFQREIERMPMLNKCVILRKITKFEEEFLLKYSGKGTEFDPNQAPLSQNTLAIQGNLRQDLRAQFNNWKQELETSGMILRPLWAKATNISKEDFFTGYRYLLAKGGSIDDLDPTTCQIPNWSDFKLENFRNAAKKNASPGQGSTAELLPILEDEPYRPSIPNALLQVLRELHTQASEDTLVKHFFFANREKDAAKPTSQILDFLEALGMVYHPGMAQFMAVNKHHLENQRTIIKQWLQKEAKVLIHDIQDIFPERAKQLEKSYLQIAFTDLTQAEQIVSKMEFGFIDKGKLDALAFIKLVQELYQFEKTIQKVSPLDPNQAFLCTTSQIKWYQDNYSKLSLWEKVHFLKWLRSQYIDKQNQILTSIEEQLVDAVNYKTIQGKSFPTAPITQVLRLIQTEVQAPIAGSTQTSMGWLQIPEYPQKISQYFLADDKYVEGWGRLEKLEELSLKTGTNSLWQRFIRQAEAWKTIINHYLQAKQAWDQLEAFLKDGPLAAKTGLEYLSKEYQNLEIQVDGGLEHDIQQQITTKSGMDLLATLEAEVKAADKYQGLAGRINAMLDEIHQNLRCKINAKRLEALNHALRAAGKPDWTAPQAKATYQQTEDAYEGF